MFEPWGRLLPPLFACYCLGPGASLLHNSQDAQGPLNGGDSLNKTWEGLDARALGFQPRDIVINFHLPFSQPPPPPPPQIASVQENTGAMAESIFATNVARVLTGSTCLLRTSGRELKDYVDQVNAVAEKFSEGVFAQRLFELLASSRILAPLLRNCINQGSNEHVDIANKIEHPPTKDVRLDENMRSLYSDYFLKYLAAIRNHQYNTAGHLLGVILLRIVKDQLS